MSHQENISIVTICDNHFAVLLGALIKSIEINHTSEDTIDLYIVNENISKKNIQKIENTIEGKKINIIWKKLAEVVPTYLKLPVDNTTFPANTYARICIPYFIDQNATKAIYLDVDMIVLTDIINLWKTDLGEMAIAAVADRSEIVSSEWGGISNYKELNLPAESKYFNSGLFVLDPQKWREMKIPEMAFKCAEDNRAYISFADQYSLNVIFNQKWKELDKSWNAYAQNNDENPKVIHFTGMKPIYTGYESNIKYKELFFYYLNQTPWNGYKPKKTILRLLKKTYNKANKKIRQFFKKYSKHMSYIIS